jgi:hypothetical protein
MFMIMTSVAAVTIGLKDGLIHGIAYRSDLPEELLSAEQYVNGLPHGVAKQEPTQ